MPTEEKHDRNLSHLWKFFPAAIISAGSFETLNKCDPVRLLHLAENERNKEAIGTVLEREEKEFQKNSFLILKRLSLFSDLFNVANINPLKYCKF
jgi:hypothetical protein